MTYDQNDNSRLRQLQLCELEILKVFADICEENNLRYYMIGGTMLGAVRHRGFIPWDDDIDVGMPRADYQRFLEIAPSLIPADYAVLNYQQNADYLRYFSRLVDTRVQIRNDSNTDTLMENAWMDIFPLDGMPDNPLARNLRFFGLCVRRVMYHFSCFEQMVNLMRPSRPAYQRLIIWFGMKVPIGRNRDSKMILDRIDKRLRRYPYDSSKYVINFFGAYVKKEIVPREWFGEGRKYLFEDRMLCGPAEYDVYLRQFFDDYMQIPKDTEKDKHEITEIVYADGYHRGT